MGGVVVDHILQQGNGLLHRVTGAAGGTVVRVAALVAVGMAVLVRMRMLAILVMETEDLVHGGSLLL